MAGTASSERDGVPALAATKIASTRPTVTGAVPAGGLASAMSVAAMTNPCSGAPPAPDAAPAGSKTIPEGTPYMTTAQRSRAPGDRPQAIQGPGQANAVGCATGTKPRPSPPSQREPRQPATSSPGGGSGTAASGSSGIVA